MGSFILVLPNADRSAQFSPLPLVSGPRCPTSQFSMSMIEIRDDYFGSSSRPENSTVFVFLTRMKNRKG